MKVILTQEVKGKGSEGDVVEVARGFAVNFLFPRKLAIAATAGNLKQLGLRRGNIEKRLAARLEQAQMQAGAIGGKTVVVEAKSGEEGRLYGSVTTTMIEDAIVQQLGVDVDRRKMDAHGHIKTLGDHAVTVAVFGDVKADLNVRVVEIGKGGETLAGLERGEALPEPEVAAQPAEAAVAAEEAEVPSAEEAGAGAEEPVAEGEEA